jgi:PTH1 family peptidyl-tRNA hydrolase
VGERIVVGLGNPGLAYARTRHNVGFMVVERLAQRWEIHFACEHQGPVVGRGAVSGVPVRLVQPRQYMNLSGPALQTLPGAWEMHDAVVVHDDIDLAPGRLRVQRNGGAGGHRGVASLVATFGSDFDRVRIGVGRPPSTQDAAEYVLESLTEEILQVMGDAVERASDAVECLLTQGLQQAMNRFNVRQSDLADDSTIEAARRSPCGDTRH